MKFILVFFILLIVCILLFIFLGSFTGVYTMQNKTGKNIIFIGVPHIGGQKYWEKIHRVLSNFQGVVLIEAVPEKYGLNEIMRPFFSIAKYTNTIDQIKGIPYQLHPDWILSDLSINEIKMFYTDKQILALQKQAEIFNIKHVWLSRALFCISAFFVYHFDNDPLVYKRNIKPGNEAMNRKDNTLIFYGQAHWQGIKKMLTKKGYKITYTQYFFIWQ